MKIVVIDNGFVFVCKQYHEPSVGGKISLVNARCIRIWGTSEGLGELYKGPTSTTVLDAIIPIVEVPPGKEVFAFDVTSAWEKHLK
jgi:hypothetical protein